MAFKDTQGYVRTEVHKAVTTIEFGHPKGNSLSSALLEQLAQQIHGARHNAGTNVIVLRSGPGNTFCGGAAFDELYELDNAAQATDFFSGFAEVINEIRECPKFVIGRIHGKCVGGGVGIAAAVDYAIALEGADIKLSELSLGFGPFVIAPVVERKIGHAGFSQLAIDARHWRSCDWAQRRGLYAELHKDINALDESIDRLADHLCQANPDAVAEMKKILWSGTEHWGRLLHERAAISGKLALGTFTKSLLAKLKK